jgi:hypothetical protein
MKPKDDGNNNAGKTTTKTNVSTTNKTASKDINSSRDSSAKDNEEGSEDPFNITSTRVQTDLKTKQQNELLTSMVISRGKYSDGPCLWAAHGP